MAPPKSGKSGVRLRLCRSDGAAADILASRRDRSTFSLARRLDWGAGFDPPEPQ
ncbi:MAG: hypothetical protein ACKOEY_16900 [Phenylobacterium sp.]